MWWHDIENCCFFLLYLLTLRRTVVTVLPYGDVYETNGVRKMFGIPFVEVYTQVVEFGVYQSDVHCLPHTKHQEGEKNANDFFCFALLFR